MCQVAKPNGPNYWGCYVRAADLPGGLSEPRGGRQIAIVQWPAPSRPPSKQQEFQMERCGLAAVLAALFVGQRGEGWHELFARLINPVRAGARRFCGSG